MERTTGMRRRALAIAAGAAFYTATAGAAQAAPPESSTQGNTQQRDTPEPQSDKTGSTLPAIAVTAGSEAPPATVGLVARRSASGTKTDTPFTEIPQTINVVTAQQIEETGATDINQALRYIPGFSTYGSENRSDWYSVLRGFTPTVFVDGLQVPTSLNLASWRVDPAMIDSVTVLRGPTSVLYGQGDPGAIIDVQSKLANGERVREAGMQLGNYARKQLSVDVGDKLDKDGRLSYRFVAVGRDGNALTGPSGDARFAVAPSVKWQPDADTSLTLSATYLQDWADASNNFLPARGTVLPNPNGVISQDLYVGDPGYSYYRKKQWSIGYQFEHRFDPVWTFRQNTRWMHLSLDNASVYGGGLDASDPTEATMTRYAGLFQMNYSRFDLDNQAQAKFGTGPVAHTLLLGFEYNRQDTTDSEWLALAPSLNMYAPVYVPVTTAIFSGPDAYPRTDTRTAMNAFGVYAQDQAKWRRWTLTLGGRQDWVNTTQNDIAGDVRRSQNDHAFTGRVGVTYEGDFGLSPYLSYSTSFNPTVIGSIKMRDGGIAAPTRGRQIEAGLRWRPPGKNLMLNAAIYQINQTHVTANDPTDPTQTLSVQAGEVRSRGIELSAVGNLTRELSLIGAYVYQDVKNIKATDDTLNKWPVDVPRPRQMASLWADWTWRAGALAGLGVGAGVRYQSAAAGAADNSLSVASYTLFDAALHYELRDWRIAINATNLFNRRFISGCQSQDVCIYGNQRTVIASAKYNW